MGRGKAMRRELLRLFALIASLLATQAARAEDAPTVMIILDGSGSMWGRLMPANRPKIDLARERLSSLLTAQSPARVGLVSFGHRRKDCSDVELIAPPDASRQAVLDPMTKLSPRGPGPITQALRMAVDAIGQSRPAQIVIVADNADNCQADTCAVASDIAKTTPGITVQVIGVGVPANERQRLYCIAAATRGHFYDITDSVGLNAAIDEATKLAMLAPSSAAPSQDVAGKAVPPPPPAGASLRASASLAEGSPLLAVPVKWRIYKAGGTTVLGRSEGRDISAKLSAGDYDIEAELGALKGRQTISAKDGDAQSIVVALNAAHLTIKAVASKGSAPSATAVITVASSGMPVTIARGGTSDGYLGPGAYDVTVSDGTARAERKVTLAAGNDTALEIALATGQLNLSAADGAGTPINDVLYTIEADDPESPDGRREVARSRDPAASFALSEGTYYIAARGGEGVASKRIAIGAGQTVNETLAIALTPVKITVLIAGVPPRAVDNILYRIDRAEGDRASVSSAIGQSLALNLSPGKYRISASLASAHLSSSKDIVVVPGKPQTVALDIQSGLVNFSPAASAVPAFGDIYWEVSNDAGMTIWRATGKDAAAILAPGRYRVRYDARTSRGQATFEVIGGQRQNVEVGPG
jgi:Ca-activated chloride channel homolog